DFDGFGLAGGASRSSDSRCARLVFRARLGGAVGFRSGGFSAFEEGDNLLPERQFLWFGGGLGRTAVIAAIIAAVPTTAATRTAALGTCILRTHLCLSGCCCAREVRLVTAMRSGREGFELPLLSVRRTQKPERRAI